MSDSLQPHRLQHARLPCPSPSPGVYSNSCPSSQWCHPIISSSVVPFSSCLQYFSASASFPMSQLFTPGAISIGASAPASVLPVNIQDWFPLELTGLISLLSKGLSRVFSNNTVQRHQFFGTRPFLLSSSHSCTWLLEKPSVQFSSFQFSRSVMFNSLQPHELQHARLLCLSPSPGVCTNSCPLSQWCQPNILSSAIPFSSCLQSFPASGLFQWVSSSHQVAKVLEVQLQHQSFLWILRTEFF